MEARCRVVVTGMGVVAPTGIGLDHFWDALIHCRSGIKPITLFDTSKHPVKVGGQIPDFNLLDYVSAGKPHRLARQTQLALMACKQAIEHAGLTAESLRQGGEPVAIVVGISSGCVDVAEMAVEIVLTRGADRVRPYMAGACQPHAIGAALVQNLNIQASVTTVSEACPSGLDAVLIATRMIQEGRADRVIAGGTDSPLNQSAAAGFAAAGLASRSQEFPPETLSRPFDAKRTGVVLSEGAGFVVLERLDVALARGATPHMEILGGAMVTDDPGGASMDGLLQSMNRALANAGIYPRQVDYICANAFGSPRADPTEVALIKQCLGTHAYRIPVTSIRGVLGHALSAAGLSQLIACALMMRHRRVVPTANLRYPDPACDLDHVPLASRSARVEVAMANSHGIGGENGSIVFRSVA